MTRSLSIPFNPHEFQRELLKTIDRFTVFVCHRKFGKTVMTLNVLIKWALTTKKRDWKGAYIAPLFRQAESIGWDYLIYYTSTIPDVKYNKSLLRCDFPNGARIELLGAQDPETLRGLYWDAVVFDEYSQIEAKTWPEIVRPNIVYRKGWAIFIGTPQGHDHFFELWNKAQKSGDWATGMYKASQTNILDPEELAKMKTDLTPEQYAQEFECSFEAALVGSYYGVLMQQALDENRITKAPYDPILLVHTAWDFGVHDATVIWFFQVSPGGEIRLIDYYEESGQGLEYYIGILKAKKYIYGQHLAPHDAKSRHMTGKSIAEVADSLGFPFDIVPKLSLEDGIQAVRITLPKCWFDKGKCDRGIQALKSYRKEYSDKLLTYRNNPLHDWSSHPADAFRTLAVGLDKIKFFNRSLKIKMPSINIKSEHGWML